MNTGLCWVDITTVVAVRCEAREREARVFLFSVFLGKGRSSQCTTVHLYEYPYIELYVAVRTADAICTTRKTEVVRAVSSCKPPVWSAIFVGIISAGVYFAQDLF